MAKRFIVPFFSFLIAAAIAAARASQILSKSAFIEAIPNSPPSKFGIVKAGPSFYNYRRSSPGSPLRNNSPPSKSDIIEAGPSFYNYGRSSPSLPLKGWCFWIWFEEVVI
ncbi:hypothetical protein NL676_037001 [Syzygium grande]|nr:hypothetical protein NL676_037001 [Syzygium grande]